MPAKQRVELNRLMWTTEARDAKSNARYGKADNAAIELGVDEVSRFGWPGVLGPCYGRIQHFFFLRATDGGRAVFMAAVNIFGSLGTDTLTGLVDSSTYSSRYILARHLNHRVMMPVVGATPSQLADLNRLRSTSAKKTKKIDGAQQQSAIARHMAGLDSARRELRVLEEEVALATSSRLLVLGARCNDVEALLDPPV